MRTILDWAANNKTRAAGIASVLIGWLALIVPEPITTGLNQILGLVLGTVVWNTVTPVRKHDGQTAVPSAAPDLPGSDA